MNFLLCPNTDNKKNISAAKAVAAHFHSLGITCSSDLFYEKLFCDQSYVAICDKNHIECDMIVAVGGDGTMLQSAQTAISLDKPIFGINSGRLGFLASFDFDMLEMITIEEIQKMTKSQRVLLDISLESKPEHHYLAINEVVASKVNYAKTAEISVCYGSNQLGCIRCDGVIVATPTGATGYSLSAGGPIVEPKLKAVVVTPICSHSLFSKSYVLADTETISIKPAERIKNEVYISIDGNSIGKIDSKDSVFAKISDKTLTLMTSQKHNFYDVLYKEISERR